MRGPGCFVCPWAAARPRAVRAASFARRVVSKPGQALPPPTGTAAWPAGDTTPIRPARPLACLQSLSKRLHRGCPKMSHVIPLRLVQILNSCRWNCNVFGWSRKMTEGNYVRNLAGGGVVAAHGRRNLARERYDPDPPRTSSCLPSITFEAAASWLPKNVARNSPAISSNFEFTSLELQRFRMVSKNDRGKLRAKFGWRCRRHRHRN